MSRGLYPLATFASTAALVGMLGTVIQLITHTFYSFGASHSTIIGLTAARVSENLSFTVMGLLVSGVAFICYQYLRARIETFDREMEHAAGELVSRLIQYFGPLRKPAVETLRPREAGDLTMEAPRLHIEPMFRHGVLQLIWPRFTSGFDADSVLQGGMWISFLYSYIGWLSYRWPRPRDGFVVCIFLLVAGLGIRAGSFASILSLLAFLEVAFVASLVPFGWNFYSACLQIAPLFLLGTLKAARFSPPGQQGRVGRLWAALHPIPAIAVVVCGLAACATVVYKELFPFLMRDFG